MKENTETEIEKTTIKKYRDYISNMEVTEESINDLVYEILLLPEWEFSQIYMQTVAYFLTIKKDQQASTMFHSLCKHRILQIAQSGLLRDRMNG